MPSTPVSTWVTYLQDNVGWKDSAEACSTLMHAYLQSLQGCCMRGLQLCLPLRGRLLDRHQLLPMQESKSTMRLPLSHAQCALLHANYLRAFDTSTLTDLLLQMFSLCFSLVSSCAFGSHLLDKQQHRI